jgi:hypothetical protein
MASGLAGALLLQVSRAAAMWCMGVYTMKRKQIYIAEEQEEQLQRLAEERRVPVSLLIREVAEYLVERDAPAIERAEEHPLWGLVGLVDTETAPSDGSVNHDAVLYRRSRR